MFDRPRFFTLGGIVLCLCLIGPGIGAPSAADEPDPWTPLRSLAGEWKGTGSGFGGDSEVIHNWSFVLDGKFLRLDTVSRPGEGDPHEDVGFLSRDSDAGAFVFRQFLSEGFVNTYDVTVSGEEPLEIVFGSREAESAGGMRARMQLTFVTDDEYTMVLDLAAPGKEFAACQSMRMSRVRQPTDDPEP